MRAARLTPSPTPGRRRGATLVEFALVLPVLILFLFGIMEYARYLMVQHVVQNAARDAARWAVVRSSSPEATTFTPDTGSRFPFEAVVDAGRPMYTVPFVTARLITQTVGVETGLAGMCVRVYTVDPVLVYANPPQIVPKQSTTAWNQGGFSERIAVQVVGQYKPILPFLGLGSNVNVNIVAMMGFEG